MRTLLLGSGGRESALAWALSRSKSVSDLIATPGNPGIGERAECIEGEAANPQEMLDLARRVGAELVVIGPEAPLVAGVGDTLRNAGISVFGPSAKAARLEGSKTYAKDVMAKAGVSTAAARSFDKTSQAVAYLDEIKPPYVVKADGLAAGKGVVVTEARYEAIGAIEDCLVARKFGVAGDRVVIEEWLEGEEVSLIAFTDGHTVIPCEPARDYKRALDGDQGPNTGGMGCYSPVPSCAGDFALYACEEIIEPVVRTLAADGIDYRGAIYAGLVLSEQQPKVLEFNARFGDPETQALLPRLESDLAAVCLACAEGELSGSHLAWSDDVCVGVVMASAGYPGPFEGGAPIEGVEAAAAIPGVEIFHAGTAVAGDELVTSGGRVLTVSALGSSFEEARSIAYEAADNIGFKGRYLRSDIGLEPAERQSLLRSQSAHPSGGVS